MKHCVLIDDDIDDREIFEIALNESKTNAICKTYRNGIEALRALTDTPFPLDYIFVDINMPEMSGYECLIEIKKISQLSEVPVFMYTTATLQQEGDIYRLGGAKDVLTKPSRMSDLIALLRSVVI